MGMCTVTVGSVEFSRKYTHCALSGILQTKDDARFMCEFGYVDAGKQNVFFMGAEGNVCQFVCVRRTQ